MTAWQRRRRGGRRCVDFVYY